MFGRDRVKKKKDVAAPPEGVSEVLICVFDEKRRVKHHFESSLGSSQEGHSFHVLNEPLRAFDHSVLADAAATHQPVSMSFSYGGGCSTFVSVLPFEMKRGKWHFACLQIALDKLDPDRAVPASVNALNEGRVCLLLADAEENICSVSADVPEAFGYSCERLQQMTLSNLFGSADLRMISASLPDTNETILNCVFHCLDGSRRDVEVKKYSLSDARVLYMVCDVTRQQLNEEITAVTTRERRRIGQDLHDSIGQMLTGISLLGRSLANGLQREGSSSSGDAAQISDLADDASNQIRQISRGLMPADIVNRGLFPSLRHLAQITTDTCGIRCEAVIDESVEFSDGAVETHLFRIAQEAVNNAVRHSGGDRIEIVVAGVDDLPQLEIKDNGRWRHIMENSGGIGMKTMQYRASVINGQLNIGQVSGGGTRVVCRLEAEEGLETKVY